MDNPDFIIEEDFPGDQVFSAADERAADAVLPFIDTSAWSHDNVPPREWAVRDIIPKRNVFLFSGEGAVGKTLLILQLAVAHVLGKDWIGTLPEEGAVIFLGAEDGADEAPATFRCA